MGHADFQITLHSRDERTAQITVAGDIDLRTRGPLSAVIDAAAAQRPERVIFDVTDVRFADSQLVHALGQARESGPQPIEVRVVGAQPEVKRVLALCGLRHLCVEAR